MEKLCPQSVDGIHQLVGGVFGTHVYCGICKQIDPIETKKSQDWWSSTHEKGCLCSKCTKT